MMSSIKRGIRVSAVLLVLAAACCAGARPAMAEDLPLYGDALLTGWADWSWDTTRGFSAVSPVKNGAYSLSVTFTAPWAGLYLHADTAVDTSGYDRLRFWIHGGTAGNQQLRIVANGNDATSVGISAQGGTWTQVSVPLSEIGNPAPLTDLYWQDTAGAAQPVFYLDDITLVARTGPPPPGPSLSVDAGAGRHPISDDIYGMNYADEQLAAELRLPVRRWGGNSTSRYNWRNDTYNTGMDWYFENIRAENENPDQLPDGSSADRFVEQDRRTGARTLMTVPMMGWVAGRRLESHPYDCGFKVSKYGPQQSVDPWDTACGNGVYAGGGNVTGNDPADTSTAIDPSFVTSWVNHLVAKYGTAANNGVAYYNLDNEPMLWNSTHRDVHPQPTTYDELRDRTYQYAAAIKSADPTARTLGPVLWGWCAYFFSALDGCSTGPDYQSHGNTFFVPWYLRQMQAYEQQNGVRILDYLDLHYYPQASGVALSSAGNAAVQALRLRSTRSLWDPDYADESWIPEAVRLIPRMRDWVTANYPGTRLAVTEYNWGGLESINGALAQADVLGIFGREGLDLATLWSPPEAAQPGAFAFRMYRNYDAAGHGFGDTGVRSVSTDQGRLAVYAAQRGSDNALTVMVINKTTNDLTSAVSLAGFIPRQAAAVYRYSAADPGAIQRAADQAVTPGGFSATFPANSITLFVIPPKEIGVTLSVDKGSPEPVGTQIVFTAQASGGSGNYEYQYKLRNAAGVWNVVRAYGTASSWTWSTAGLATGFYKVEVLARNAGSTAAWEAYKNMSFRLIAPASAVTLTASAPSPQSVGNAITLTAAASGGSGSYEYQFRLRNPAGAWSVARGYGTAPSWTWDTTSLAAGSYKIEVWARNVGSASAWEAYKNMNLSLRQPVSSVSLNTDRPSPQPRGTSVLFTASATGASGSYVYQYRLRTPSGVWGVARDYSSSDSWSWNTSAVQATGSYLIEVWAKNTGSNAAWEAFRKTSYTLQ